MLMTDTLYHYNYWAHICIQSISLEPELNLRTSLKVKLVFESQRCQRKERFINCGN